MRSSYSGRVIGAKMSTCTWPRIFMPAPWITRTLGIVLSVRTGMVRILRGAGRCRDEFGRPMTWTGAIEHPWAERGGGGGSRGGPELGSGEPGTLRQGGE